MHRVVSPEYGNDGPGNNGPGMIKTVLSEKGSK